MAGSHEKRDMIGEIDVKVDKSKFSIKTIGQASENLPLGEHILEVLPIEHLGYVNGEVNSEREKLEVSGEDAKGNAYNVSIETSNSIKAEWLQWGSNRHTPPNIRRGERVLIWQYAEEDKYYWTAMGLDDYLRRLETVIWAFSDTKNEEVRKLTPDNSYFVEVNTHDKHITLKTCKEDGEPFKYTIQIDTKKGKILIIDDIENSIGLNSEDKTIWMENADKSKVVLDKKEIEIYAPDKIKIETKDLEIKTKSAKHTTKTYTINSDTTKLKGSTFTVNANTSTYGKLTNNTVNVGSTHLHGGVFPGGSVTTTPQ